MRRNPSPGAPRDRQQSRMRRALTPAPPTASHAFDLQRVAAIAVAVALWAVAQPDALLAQQPPALPPVVIEGRAPPAAGPRTITGIVVDTADVPVDSIEIFITALQRRAFTDVNGAFRFADVRPGTYELRARRLGFAPQIRRVTVDRQQGATTKFMLLRISHALPAVVSSTTRGGLSGVVGDTAFNAIPGAAVRVLASDRRTVSDSEGAFFLDVKPGKYMVEVTRPGFSRRLLSLTVPYDSGRRVVVWMTRGASGNRDYVVTRDLVERLMTRRATSAFYTREDIGRFQFQWLKELVVSGSGMPVSDDCEATVDGVWRTPVYSLTVEELESVEVYPPGTLPSLNEGRISRTRPPTSINRAGTRGSIAQQRITSIRPGVTCPGVYVWTKR